ncbi:MAG: metal-dependent transcriptional regulator [Planctomycetes bacterium]|nr:metal-dependent transcriptional regulator [Planctomycetota bacterium]
MTIRISAHQIAEGIRLSPSGLTMLFKATAAVDLVDYQPRHGVSLTTTGRRTALLLLRRHRLVETFLHRILRLDWAEVHDEAQLFDAAVSERVLEQMDSVLGNPELDPHGDPIPNRNGRMPGWRDCCARVNGAGPLTAMSCDQLLRVEHVVGNDAALLRYLGQAGVRPGAIISVQTIDQAAETMNCAIVDRTDMTLGLTAARWVHVKPVGDRS